MASPNRYWQKATSECIQGRKGASTFGFGSAWRVRYPDWYATYSRPLGIFWLTGGVPAGCKALLCALQIGAAIPPAPGILSRTKKSSPAGGCIVLYAGYIAATSPTSPHSTTNHGCNTGAPSLLLFILVMFPNNCFFQAYPPSDYLCPLSVHNNDHIYSCSDLGGFVCGRIGR